MSDIIVATSTGTELRTLLFREYDFEIGDKENSFLITCNRSEWENIPDNARIYIPGVAESNHLPAVWLQLRT